MSSKHWHIMGGFSGCLPEFNEVFRTKQDSINFACELYDEVEGIKTALTRLDFFRFPIVDVWSGCTGLINYIELCKCYDKECLEEEGEF